MSFYTRKQMLWEKIDVGTFSCGYGQLSKDHGHTDNPHHFVKSLGHGTYDGLGLGHNI